MKTTKPRPATAQWGLFLRNHDELDLGRLSKQQRERSLRHSHRIRTCNSTTAASADGSAPMLEAIADGMELAYSLLFTLPGTPVIRYGDELGMGDDLKLPERNCARTPMQWSNEPHGGFTRATSRCSSDLRGPLRL